MLTQFYSNQAGGPAHGTSLDNTRRLYDFGNVRMAHLRAEETLFMSYLMKMGRLPTSDPIFKNMERRDQWQRRRFQVASTTTGVNATANHTITGVKLASTIDKYGRELKNATAAPEFVLPDQVVTLMGQVETAAGSGVYANARFNALVKAITATTGADITATLLVTGVAGDGDYATALAGRKLRVKAHGTGADSAFVGTVIGSAFAELTGSPAGWTDELYDREGRTQIFKTSVPMMSGTAQATVHRGIPNEWLRVWEPKMKEHKMDLTRSMLFNVGQASVEGNAVKRVSNGYIPYIEKYGVVQDFSYGSTTYDDVMGFFEWFMDPERGIQNKLLAFTSRRVISWANKLGDSGFLKNTVGTAAYRIAVDNVQGQFGHNITRVWTPFGTVGFVEETQLRGEFGDVMVLCDPSKVYFRPLEGNGVSRDTKVHTNVQDTDLDGRKDMILTEAGFGIDLPELHAIWRFS